MPKGTPKSKTAPKVPLEVKPLTGDHQVSVDGTEMFIGKHRFKRTVLRSVATPDKDTEHVYNTLDEIEQKSFQEKDSDE